MAKALKSSCQPIPRTYAGWRMLWSAATRNSAWISGVLGLRLDPRLDVGQGDQAAEPVPLRGTAERVAGEGQALAGLAAPPRLQLRHPFQVGLEVQRVATQRGVAPCLVDGETQRHAAAGGEEPAPRRHPFRAQLGGLEQLFLGDAEPLVEDPPLFVRDLHGP